MSQYYGEAPSFSILDVLRGMGRRKLFVLSSLLLGALLGFGIVAAIKPKYQAEARILIDNFATPYDSANVNQLERVDNRVDERVVSSQVAVLQSEDLGKRVISQLGLSQKAEFDPMKSGIGMLGQFLIRFGFADDPQLMTMEQRAYDKLSGSLTVYPIPTSNVIAIKYTSRDAETAALVANAVAETYSLSTREVRIGDTSRARDWLASQIEGLREKVAKSDAEVEKYRVEAGLLKGQTTTLGIQQTSELNTQITAAEAAEAEAQAKADEIRELLETQGSVEASSEVLASATIQRLREQQVSADRKLTDLSVTYLDNHPKMVAARKEVRDIDSRIRREALKIVDSLQGQAKIAAVRASTLRKSLEKLKSREGNALQDEVKLKELEREAKANRDQLEVMLARYADTNTRQNLELQPGFARIIQTATVPAAPFFPKSGPVILLASLAGLGLGLGLSFLLEIMAQAARASEATQGGNALANRGRQRARDLKELDVDIPELEVPVVSTASRAAPAGTLHSANMVSNVVPVMAPLVTLASIPNARTSLDARTVLSSLSVDGANYESLGQLSTHLQTMRNKGSFKACAIAGVGGGCEGAALALALARHLADIGLKTILVDLDGKRNLLADLLELPHAPGLTELLSGSSDFNKAIQRDNASSLQFLRHGSHEFMENAQLSARMETITSTLIGIYQVVVLHVGEASPAMLQMIKGCGTVLLHAPTHRKQDVIAAAGTLKSKGFPNVFLVQVDGTQQAAA
jgi:polysaccharide biosynthesis transport protein